MRPWVKWLLIILVLMAAGAYLERIAMAPSAPGKPGAPHFLAYYAAGLFGLLVGATELVARYRDKPSAPLQTLPGFIYIAVNGSVSLVAFWLLQTEQLKIGVLSGVGLTLNNVLVAGFGSMALFRTSLFTLRVKDTDIAVGPAAVLQVILTASDRACDRLRAGPRAVDVKRIMRGVSYARATPTLPLHCLALMQNVSAEEQSQLNQAVAALSSASMSDEAKSYNLGLLLMTVVGEDVLQQAVDALGPIIQGPAKDDPPIFSQAGMLVFADMDPLISLCTALDPLGRETEVGTLRGGWLTVDPPLEREINRNVVILARLRRYFGPDTLARAITQLIAGKPLKPVTGDLSLKNL